MDVAKLFPLLIVFSFAAADRESTNTKHYIVYMGEHSFHDSESVVQANLEMLVSLMGSHNAAVHHYTKTFRGFSAMLTSDQARKLKENGSVVSVFKSKTNYIQTTHSWEFLGITNLEKHHQPPINSTSDVIIGVVDTGVWPESKSFDDHGFGPVPTRFRGVCSTGQNFTSSNCNRKIVGARFYLKGFIQEHGSLESFNKTFFLSPRDADGHGTHTASTIAGSEVPNVSLYGIGRGTARGGVPKARLSIYKACWFGRCNDADVLSALDDAIHDGVDVLSLSLASVPPHLIYFSDVIAIGSFHAFKKGVVVCASAGNGIFPTAVTNVAPWILTVAASTVDREIRTNIHLGNSQVIKGFSVNPFQMKSFYGLIAGSSAAAHGIPSANASFCKNNTLYPPLVEGKIVICTLEGVSDNRNDKASTVKQGGGVGIILVDPQATDIGFQFEIPGTLISIEEAQKLQAYMVLEQNPMARILKTVTVQPTKPAPQMALFSSKGPNVISPDIIKPDVTAPGVNILAAWSPFATANTAGRSIHYNINSGTSMSCPLASAVAAIVKSFHPSWSPAAIKSAIMTTAKFQDNNGRPITRHPNGTQATPFDYGSGHVNPFAAIDPGLVYDFDTKDIIDFLCSTNASQDQLRNLTGKITNCAKTATSSYDFNYPSIGVSNLRGKTSLHRIVTYYGEGPAVYKAEVDSPPGVCVSVTPDEMRFKNMGEKMSFKISIVPYDTSNGESVFGALTWSDGVHVVRSPIGLNVVSL